MVYIWGGGVCCCCCCCRSVLNVRSNCWVLISKFDTIIIFPLGLVSFWCQGTKLSWKTSSWTITVILNSLVSDVSAILHYVSRCVDHIFFFFVLWHTGLFYLFSNIHLIHIDVGNLKRRQDFIRTAAWSKRSQFHTALFERSAGRERLKPKIYPTKSALFHTHMWLNVITTVRQFLSFLTATMEQWQYVWILHRVAFLKTYDTALSCSGHYPSSPCCPLPSSAGEKNRESSLVSVCFRPPQTKCVGCPDWPCSAA